MNQIDKGQSPAPPHKGPYILAIATRDQADLFSIKAYLQKQFPHAQVTYLVPVTFKGCCPGLFEEHDEIVTYTEGGLSTWPEKLRIVAYLRRVAFEYCILPMRFSYRLKYDVLMILPLIVKAPVVLVTDPDGLHVTTVSKTSFLERYTRTYLATHSARLREWLSRWYMNRIERLVRTYVDPCCFLLLTLLALIHRFAVGVLFLPGDRRGKGYYHDDRDTPVAYFISNLDVGGTQRQLYTLMTRLSHRVTVVSVLTFVRRPGPFEDLFKNMGIPMETVQRTIDEPGLTQIERFLWSNLPYTMSVLRLVSLLKARLRPAVLHNWEFKANCIGAVAGALAGIPVIISSVRNMSYWKIAWDPVWWYRLADILSSRLNDVIIANAEAVRKDYTRWALLPAGSVLTVYNGLDAEQVGQKDQGTCQDLKKELGIDGHAPVVGWVGRLWPQKHPEAFLEMAVRILVTHPLVSFVVIGEGVLAEPLRQAAQRMEISEQVHFVGLRSDVYRWMQVMDVLVMTSIIEGMPNVLIEAQLLGIPCVTTAAGGASVVVQDRVTGFVVPVGDIDGLVARVSQLLDDRSLVQRFVEQGRKRALTLFSADTLVERHLELYTQMAEKKGL